MDRMGQIRIYVRLMGVEKDCETSEFWITLEKGSSLSDLLKHLEEKGCKIPYPGFFILLNGKFVTTETDHEIKLENLDRVIVIPPLGGGSILSLKFEEFFDVQPQFYLRKFQNHPRYNAG